METRGTIAHRYVIDDVANGTLAASSRARIHAFVANASSVSGTLGTDNALGSTSRVRVALIFGQAGAYAVVALSVSTAGGRIARVCLDGFDF
jgi:hypothetical protein